MPQGRSGPVQKISLPPGFDYQTAQPVASRYTDCAIPAHTSMYMQYKNFVLHSTSRSMRTWCMQAEGEKNLVVKPEQKTRLW